jgi:hypothetical protein
MIRISRRSVVVCAAVALAAILITPNTVSATGTGQVEALWKDYVVAKKRFQFDLSRLLAGTWPELEGVARLQRDQQFAMIELRNMKFQYLLENDPDRIILDDGLSAFANFDWTEEDDEALREANADFAKLQRWAAMNDQRLSDHPKFPAAQERLERLQREEHFRSMHDSFELRLDDLETTLSLMARRAKKTKAPTAQDTMKASQTD